jgi:hypothetical protein
MYCSRELRASIVSLKTRSRFTNSTFCCVNWSSIFAGVLIGADPALARFTRLCLFTFFVTHVILGGAGGGGGGAVEEEVVVVVGEGAASPAAPGGDDDEAVVGGGGAVASPADFGGDASLACAPVVVVDGVVVV